MSKKNKSWETSLSKKAETNNSSRNTKNSCKPFWQTVTLTTISKLVRPSVTVKRRKPDWCSWKTKSRNKCSTWIGKSSRSETELSNNMKTFYVISSPRTISIAWKMDKTLKSSVIISGKCTKDSASYHTKAIEANFLIHNKFGK
jgi:hypothetical protein